MELLYQDELLERIIRFNKLPQTILLVGEEGCGKTTLSKIIAKKYNLEWVDITGKITPELVEEMALSVTPTLYKIDVSELTPATQSSLLKIIEEPYDNSYFALTTTDISRLDDTINNRCYKLFFYNYLLRELKTFSKVDKPHLLGLFRTPGQVINYFNDNIDKVETIYNSSKELLDKLENKTLTYIEVLNNYDFLLKSKTKKQDVKIFLKCLSTYGWLKLSNPELFTVIYTYYNASLYDKRLSEESLLRGCLSNLWGELNG